MKIECEYAAAYYLRRRVFTVGTMDLRNDSSRLTRYLVEFCAFRIKTAHPAEWIATAKTFA